MSFVCSTWKTTIELFYRPQTQGLTFTRWSRFCMSPGSINIGKKSSKMWTLPETLYFSKNKIHCTSSQSTICWKKYFGSWGYRKFSAINLSAVQHVHNINKYTRIPDERTSAHFSTHSKDSDINQQNSWMTMFPKEIQPYLILARLDRPIGYWLLFLPCAWSISLAAQAGHLPNFKLLTLFFVGSVVMRSAGCVINDLWDSDLDKKVARTSSRPIAANTVTSFQALVFLGSQLSIALGILLSLNNYSIVLGASSLPLIVTYPLMKRITFWPQLFLGLTMNWGCLLGWTAVNGSLDWPVCLPLYAAGMIWTIIYDTIYAFQDVEDDRLVGVKSTALLFGDKTKPYLVGFSALMIASLLLAGINSSQTWPFYLGLFGVTSHLAWQISQVDLSQAKDCLSKFKSNRWLGILLFVSVVLSTLMKPEDKKDKMAQ